MAPMPAPRGTQAAADGALESRSFEAGREFRARYRDRASAVSAPRLPPLPPLPPLDAHPPGAQEPEHALLSAIWRTDEVSLCFVAARSERFRDGTVGAASARAVPRTKTPASIRRKLTSS